MSFKPTLIDGKPIFISGTEKRFFCPVCKVWVLRILPCPGCDIRDDAEGVRVLQTKGFT
jgi:hypothetical protein